MKATIKDVANLAGVSIATVSHTINKTRYVRPELVEKVNQAIIDSGYHINVLKQVNNLRVGKESIIAYVFPNIGGTVYSQLSMVLSRYLEEKGYLLSIYLTSDDKTIEKHLLASVMSDKKVAGIILAPVCSDANHYRKLLMGNKPFICLERTIRDCSISSVLSDNKTAIYRATKHLIESGHEKIAIVVEERDLTTVAERLEGYTQALKDGGLEYNVRMIIRVDLYQIGNCSKAIQEAQMKEKPTAVIAGGNRLTLTVLKAFQEMGLECPGDVSVIGFGDEEWCELAAPPLTTVKQNTEEMGRLAAERMYSLIQGNQTEPQELRVKANLSIRKSTQMIGRGPFGEKAVSPAELQLSNEEIMKLKESDYKVGIAFHFGGTAWARLHENGIRDTLQKYGITVISVSDAHFDAKLQVTQLDGLKLQKVDAIIAIPADDKVTAEKFKELSRETKLIFMSNVPAGMTKNEYASCVSVDERENGQNGGVLLGEHFKNKTDVEVGFISHGAPFYGTRLRDMVAEQTVRENYPNIEVVDTQYFYQIERSYEVCREMIENHPNIKGLYVSWDRPALEVIRALKELGRRDIAIVTFDLDEEIAVYLAKEEMVVGMTTQRPYEQGVAVALATAKALLHKEGYKYIGVHPYVIQTKNLLRAWRDIMHEPAPEYLEKLISEKFT